MAIGTWPCSITAFHPSAASSAPPPSLIVPTAPAVGTAKWWFLRRMRVRSFGRLPLAHIELLLQVWGTAPQARSSAAISPMCCRLKIGARRLA